MNIVIAILLLAFLMFTGITQLISPQKTISFIIRINNRFKLWTEKHLEQNEKPLAKTINSFFLYTRRFDMYSKNPSWETDAPQSIKFWFRLNGFLFVAFSFLVIWAIISTA
jgi:hypothetical protein